MGSRTDRRARPWLFAPTCVVLTLWPGCLAAAQLGSPSTPPDRTESESLAPPTAVERSQIRERAIARLVEMAHDDWALIRANAIEGLIPARGRLREVLPAALVDLNEGVRSVAAMAVGRARLVELAGLVEPLRLDPSEYVRASAIYALDRCGRDVDPSPLADLLLTSGTPRVRSHVAFILGEMGNPSAIPMLRQASAAEMPLASAAEMRLLRLQIAEAMVKLGAAEDQIHVVRAALFPSRPDELEATALAVQIIGTVRDEHSAGLLVQMVESPVAEAKGEKAGGRRMPSEVRLAAIGALAEMGRPDGRFAVAPYLTDPRGSIRSQAAHVLGIGRTSVYALLRKGELGSVRLGRSRRIPSRFLRYRLNSGKRDAAGFVLFPVYAIFAKITFARTGRIPETRNRIVQGIRAVLTQNKKFSHEKTIPNPVCRSPVLSDIQGDRRLHQLHHHPGSLLGRLGDGLLRRRLPPALRRTLQNLRRALQTRHDAPGL